MQYDSYNPPSEDAKNMTSEGYHVTLFHGMNPESFDFARKIVNVAQISTGDLRPKLDANGLHALEFIHKGSTGFVIAHYESVGPKFEKLRQALRSTFQDPKTTPSEPRPPHVTVMYVVNVKPTIVS